MGAIFHFVPDTLGHMLYNFSNQAPPIQSQKVSRKLKKPVFWITFYQFPRFLPSPYPNFRAKL